MSRQPPRPLVDVDGFPRVLDAVDYAGTEDPAEIRLLTAEWVRKNGPYTHVMLWCGPHVITATGEPTTVVVPKQQFATPCPEPCADIVPTSAEMWKRRAKLDDIPYMSWCYLPLMLATRQADDEGWLVRVRKIGATKLLAVPDGGAA